MSDASDPPPPSALEDIAAHVARAAGALIRGAVARPAAVAVKTSPTDVVTDTDLRAEALIRSELLAATPGAGIVGEEEGQSAPDARLQWVVDPLDGTVNFLYGLPVFAVSIAAAIDGEVVAGAVLDVGRDELFRAHRGGGARGDGEVLTASACAELGQAMVATGFSYRAAERARQGAIAAELVGRARDLRCPGSTALELCWVACGRLDAYYQSGTSVWDRAAGTVIAAEAGAVVELPSPENGDLVLAAAPGIYEALRPLVAA